jgi:hypothetical protein
MLWFETRINEFKANPGKLPEPKYGVHLVKANAPQGENYWRVIGVHHLEPLENYSNRNIYIVALDEQGQRIKIPVIWAGWTWEGRRNDERADPVPLDKPNEEPAGNISVGSGQIVSVWIKGASRDANDKSDRVENLHTVHPDEPLPDGRKLNTIGHHSFLVVFQRTRVGATVPPPPDPRPVPEPAPEPVNWLTHFDDRQRKQIAFSRLYAKDFSHGATGHNDMLIIAKMAELLDGK